MGALYLHIPFCQQRCNYCNFFSSTLIELKQQYIKALQKEIELRCRYLPSASLNSVYFGGGTPSLLTSDEINQIFDTVCHFFTIPPHAEITLEANPNSLTQEYVKSLTSTAINRLSIGIQSFSNADLQVLGRIHSDKQAHLSIQYALQYGYSNLSVDLMYAYPLLTLEQWKKNLEYTKGIPHLSCYALTLEPSSALSRQIQKNIYTLPSEDETMAQYQMLIDYARSQNMEHYETSNFCLPGHYSVHNTAYWQNQPYLGIGCGAHSFNGHSRQWNIGNIPLYIQHMQNTRTPEQFLSLENLIFEKENLSVTTRVNEYIMTSLRTMWGCDLDYIAQQFSPLYAEQLLKKTAHLPASQYILQSSVLHLTEQGALFADAIACELFFDENGNLK
ncbi:MAG: radical SAM family heme chaperone HemW [Bacteroidales bacterium]|nr:radical SAM family heme chaperone HemW [Bacteroidales bacterium]